MNTNIFNEDGSVKDSAIVPTAKTELADAPGTYVLNGISTADGWPVTFEGKCLLIIPGSTQLLITTHVLYANGSVWHRDSADDEWKFGSTPTTAGSVGTFIEYANSKPADTAIGDGYLVFYPATDLLTDTTE